MIKKLKSKMSALIKSRRLQLAAASVLCIMAIAGTTLLNTSIHTFKVFDGKKTYVVRSLNNNVAMIMDDIMLESQDYAIVETETEAKLTSIKISYTFPVYITCGDKTVEIDFHSGTVADALQQAGFTPDKYDFTEPSLETEIKDTLYIDYTDINYHKTTKKESVDFKTKTVYSSKVEEGTKEITTKGQKGINLVTTTVKTVNGVEVKSSTKVEVVKKPKTQKITIGTKDQNKISKSNSISVLSPDYDIELDENGVPVNYKSKLKVRATAYTHTGNRCSTGVKPKPGYIAVNPKVIPYGTKMYIKTSDGKYIYGYAVAADTGGFIKKHPTGIDLFFDTESECRKFGVRTAEIYILE